VQNLAPGAADRMGLSYADLQPNHPRLITCNISGYGANGPYRDRKAYDLLIQSEAGFLSVTGTPDDMVKAGISVADIAAGMYAYSNILAALIQRGQTGQGCNIDLSMLEALTEWMGYPMYYAHDGAPPPERAGAAHSTIFPYGPFPAGDGRDVMLGLQNEREWVQFCDHVLDDPSLAQDNRFKTNGDRAAHKSELTAIIRDCFSKLTADQVIEKLDAAGIANAHINDMAGLWCTRNWPRAIGGVRWIPPPDRWPHCCPQAALGQNHGWIQSLIWASIRMRFWPNWAMTMPQFRNFAPQALSDPLYSTGQFIYYFPNI
jgi:itaconate CoA-transferase